MWDVSAFTSVGVQPIVYCRAAGVGPSRLTWRQAQNCDLFNWPEEIPVRRFATVWDRHLKVRGGLSFLRFRERIRQISSEAISYLTDVVVIHDFETLMRVVDCFEKYVVIPVDDDDLLSPKIGSSVGNPSHPLRDNTTVVCWPDLCWWCSFDGSGNRVEHVRSQPAKSLGTSAVGSNSYGLTERALRVWGAEAFKTCLEKHWTVQSRVKRGDLLILPDEFLSLEIKHVGCTSWLTERTGNDYWWTRDVDISTLPLWASDHCEKVRELHTQLLTDMGGTFDHDRLISEAASLGAKHE